MDTKKFYTKQIEKAQEVLDNEGLEAYAEYMSKQMITSEACMFVAIMALCNMRDGDNRGQAAQWGAMLEQGKDLTMAGHRIYSVVGAQMGLLDIPGEGGR